MGTDAPHTGEQAGTGTRAGQPDAITEVFISPRVIDRTAFESYASSLRAIVADAGERAEGLKSAAGEVRRLRDGLRDATGELGTRVEKASKLLPALEERVRRAEAALARMTDGEALAREVDRIVEARVRERVDARLEAIEARLAAAGSKGVAAIEARERESRQELEAAIANARDSVSGALADIERRLADLHDGPGGAIDRIRTQASPILAQADGLLAELGERSSAVTGLLAVSRERGEALAISLAALCDRAERVSSAAALEEAEARASGLIERATATRDELRSIVERADAARETLGAEIRDGSERVEAIARTMDGVLERATTLDASAAGAEERARHAVQEAEQRAHAMVREVEARWQAMGREAERASAWVGGLIDQARQEQQRLTQAIAQQHAMLERLDRLARELEPWREFVAAGGTGGKVGATLDEMVRRTRTELGEQIASAAGALQEIAQRAASFGTNAAGAAQGQAGLYDDAHLRRGS